MKTPKAPEAPDPAKTAAAQTGTNVATAVANTATGNVNQVTPDGSLTYSQSGTYKFTDPSSGKVYDLPTWTATTTLSDAQKAIKAQTDAAELNMGQIANQQSGFLKDYLGKPVDLSNEATESRLMELGRKRLDPVLASNRSNLETSLANRGIQSGSAAWNTAMGQLGQNENDAYNSLLLSGRQQAVQEKLTERNQPINEISALLSGAQVSQPNFVGTQTAAMPTTDVAGITMQGYQNALSAWQTKVNAQNAQLGAIAGVAGAGLGGWLGR